MQIVSFKTFVLALENVHEFTIGTSSIFICIVQLIEVCG